MAQAAAGWEKGSSRREGFEALLRSAPRAVGRHLGEIMPVFRELLRDPNGLVLIPVMALVFPRGFLYYVARIILVSCCRYGLRFCSGCVCVHHMRVCGVFSAMLT